MNNRTCTLPGCERKLRSKGYCSIHYNRLLRTGTPGSVDPIVWTTDGKCTVEGCDNPVSARAWCKTHYNSWYRKKGFMFARSRPAAERFWPRVAKGEPDECWEWAGYRRADGYGQFHVTSARSEAAHRFSFREAHGDIPALMQVDHMCHNRACVNPAHLRLATNKQNQENLSGPTVLSKTGVLGVHKRANGRYRARVKHHGVYVFNELFDDLDEAAKAVAAARKRIYTHAQDPR